MNKKLIISLILFFSIAIISTILYFIFKKPSTSSTSSLCNKNCKNGKCDTNDTCICNTGYSGTDCSITCSCKSPANGSCNDDGTCNCNPVFTGDNCDKCKNSTFTGDNCDKCTLGYAPPDCSQCSPMFTGDKCSECVTPFYGSDGGKGCKVSFSATDTNGIDCFLTFSFIDQYKNYYPCSTQNISNKYEYTFSNSKTPGFYNKNCFQYSFLWDKNDIYNDPSYNGGPLNSANGVIRPIFYKLQSQTSPIIFDIYYQSKVIGTATLSLT